MAELVTFRHESAVIQRLLGLLLAPPSSLAAAEILTPERQRVAKTVFFMLDIGARANAETFMTYTLLRLLRQLSHNTMQRPVTYRGQVRGRVQWPATFKARHGEDYDPNRYVCREVHHLYDNPENQLLKFMVEHLATCLQAMPPALRTGGCYFGFTKNSQPPALATAARLEKMEFALTQFRRNIYLHDVEAPARITEQHLLHAETARMEEYAEVARLYRRYTQFMASATWEELFEMGKRVLPLPGNVGPEADPWINLGAAIVRHESFANVALAA